MKVGGAGRSCLALAVVALVYATIALTRPAAVFWSPDQGGKLLQVEALLAGRFDLSIEYPGRALDPELLFRPYLFSYPLDGHIRLPWPMAWALPSSLFYSLLGAPGLILLPVLGGLLASWAAGRLAERLAPGSGWLGILLAGLATPVFILSTLFWEHAPAAGLFALGLLLAPLEVQPCRRRSLLLAGLCFGLAVAWRNEVLLYLVALAVAAWPRLRLAWRSLGMPWLAAGFCLVVLPVAAYNLRSTESIIARTPALAGAPDRTPTKLAADALQLPADLLVGAADLGLNLPEPLRWAPALGLLALVGSGRARGGGTARPLRLVGLLLVACPTAGLLLSPVPQGVHGFLIAAPCLALPLLAIGRLSAMPTGRTLLIFGLIALPLYALAALLLHRQGLSGGGAEWGSRFLLPVYPPLVALAAASLQTLPPSLPAIERAGARLLVVLGIAFQLVGLVQVDRALHQFREEGQFIAALPPGPVVLRPGFLVLLAPGLTQTRPVFCTDTPAMLSRWADLALKSGEREAWFLDFGGLRPSWLRAGVLAPLPLTATSVDSLYAARYDLVALRSALRREGPESPCGAAFGA